MKQRNVGIGLLLGGLLALTTVAQDAGQEHPRVVLGTFDSRAVAVAYVRSDAFEERMRGLQAELAEAQEAGDEARVAELEVMGPALQAEIHRQGFGAAPVDDIVALIADELPGIAAKAGVDVIVSKWVVAYRHQESETVDVTERLASAFDPDEATWRSIRDLVKTAPVPLEDLAKHDH
jgi:hypothetical protein